MNQVPGRKARKAEESWSTAKGQQSRENGPSCPTARTTSEGDAGWHHPGGKPTMKFHLQKKKSNRSTTSMAFSSKAHVIDLTKGDSTGFTRTSGILPTESTANILPAKPSSGGKREKDLDDNDVLANMLTREDTTFLLQELDKFNSEIDELFAALNVFTPDGRPPTVLELCCEEDSGLTKAIEQHGGSRHTLWTFQTLRLEQTEWFQQGEIPDRGAKPDAVWVALPCGPISSIQGLNKLTPEGMEKVQAKVAKSRKLAGRAVTPMELQVGPGGEVIQEWPRYNNKGWKFNCVQTFWNRREHHEAITKPMPMAVPMDFVHQVVELSRNLGDSGARHVAFGTCNDFANVKNHMFLVKGVI